MTESQQAPQAVQSTLDKWVKAELESDIGRLDEILMDDFVGVGPFGFTLSKEAWLGRYRQGDFRYQSLRLEEPQTRVHGDAAVVTAHQVSQSFMRDQAVPFTDLRVTFALVNVSGEWRLSGAHSSFIAGTPGAPPLPAMGRGEREGTK